MDVPAGFRRCPHCRDVKPLDEGFSNNRTRPGGKESWCKVCRAAAQRDRVARAGGPRLAPGDFDVASLNDGRVDARAGHEKRQEYSRQMGRVLSEVSEAVTSGADGPAIDRSLSDESREFLGTLAEQEERYGNRRAARSFSIAAAHEVWAMNKMKEVAETYFRDKVQPVGWSLVENDQSHVRPRTVNLLLSDLHLGADLGQLDEPMPYRAIEESRRLEYVLRQAADYKPQYRANSQLNVYLNGDIFDGMLLHDPREGIPLVEQKAAFYDYFRKGLGYLASAYPRVCVYCQPGNHGRDKARHQGRATSRKWDGHEWEAYYSLSQMFSEVKNISFDIPFRAVTVVDLYGAKLLLTHGDTEVPIGHPLKAAEKNAALLDNLNSTQRYGCRFAAAAFGHYHFGIYVPGAVRLLHNGALVPPNGYARSYGPVHSVCGQFIWESVEGYPVGDVRFIEVGVDQDHDERLGTIIQPFRFQEPRI